MTLNLIDNEIINVFFKFYKKDIKSIGSDLFENVTHRISQNVEKLINDEDAKNLILQKFSDYEFSFFHVVAKFGSSKDLKKIIEIVGIKNLNHGDINNYTALHHCSISGRLDNVKVLIGFGANINAKSSNETRNWYPIHYACKYGFKEIVEEFIESGVDKEVRTLFGLTPLHVACEFGNIFVVEYLIKIGCNLDAETIPENQRMTPLHYAVMINSVKTVKILCASGADVFKNTHSGSDALILATKRNYSKIVEILINRGMVDSIEEAYKIAIKNNCFDSRDILEVFIKIRDKLFEKSNLVKFSKSINEFIKDLKPQNIDESYLSLFFDHKISVYFLNKISKKIGVLKKNNYTLETYAKHIGLDVLSKNLKEIDEIITHKKISKKY
ncbi:MAG: ankyrin repeat domain-containing protein [Proteobacteria bacterium]|nr:ankyrin repeat domain-containing protein [Pseudomonadota bacterium]